MATTNDNYFCDSLQVPKVWSSSSLATISSCRRKFFYQYIEGWTGSQENLDFTFGSGLHSCLEWYWHRRITGGLDKESALNETVGVAFALGLFLPPIIRDKQKGKTRIGLVNAVIWYVDRWAALDNVDDFTILDGVPALEQHFQISIPLPNPDGNLYQIQGYVDNLRDFAGLPTTTDYKSTADEPSDYYFDKFNISLQTIIYTAASRILTSETYTNFLVDVVGVSTRKQGLPYEMPVAFMKRHMVTLTNNTVDEGMKDILSLIKDAEKCAEEKYYPKNESSCTFCDFRTICTLDPELRQPFLESSFTKKPKTLVVR
jgi:hypothetical protein